MSWAGRIALFLGTAAAAVGLVAATNYGSLKRYFAGESAADRLAAAAAADRGAAGLVAGESVGGEEAPAAIVLGGEDVGQRRQIAELQEQIAGMDEGQWLKGYKLTASDGSEVGTEELRGQPYIACFFFSTCPGSCKQQTDQMRLLQQKYRDDPIRLVSITVDPEIDTPEVLDAYADAAGAQEGKWFFLTGEMAKITKIGGEVFMLGAISRRGHPDRFCLVDAQGKLVGKYNWHDARELQQLDEHVAELLAERPEDASEPKSDT